MDLLVRRGTNLNMWGAKVIPSKTYLLVVPEDRDLVITRAALSPTAEAGATTLKFMLGNGPRESGFLLGTLRAGFRDQMSLSLQVAAGSVVQFSAAGNPIILSGYFNCAIIHEKIDYPPLTPPAKDDSDDSTGPTDSDEESSSLPSFMQESEEPPSEEDDKFYVEM